jgi:hypothetical protein
MIGTIAPFTFAELASFGGCENSRIDASQDNDDYKQGVSAPDNCRNPSFERKT